MRGGTALVYILLWWKLNLNRQNHPRTLLKQNCRSCGQTAIFLSYAQLHGSAAFLLQPKHVILDCFKTKTFAAAKGKHPSYKGKTPWALRTAPISAQRQRQKQQVVIGNNALQQVRALDVLSKRLRKNAEHRPGFCARRSEEIKLRSISAVLSGHR